MTPNKLIIGKQMRFKRHEQMGQGGRVKFLSKLKVFRSEQSSLPGELAATFIASLEAPKNRITVEGKQRHEIQSKPLTPNLKGLMM